MSDVFDAVLILIAVVVFIVSVAVMVASTRLEHRRQQRDEVIGRDQVTRAERVAWFTYDDE